MTTQQTKEIATKHIDEYILVVKREKLFSKPAWQGLYPTKDFQHYLSIIKEHQEFHPRSLMESDPTYKQIIPYLVFKYNDTFFLMQRQDKATETRLKSKYSLGIGGHIRQEDLISGDIIDWARREFNEEVSYEGGFTITPIGILNDDSNEVGKVHVGFIFLLEGTHNKINVKSELKSGKLLSLNECQHYYENMESWSKIVFNVLYCFINK